MEEKGSDQSVVVDIRFRTDETGHSKTCLRVFRPGQTKRQYSHRRLLEASDSGSEGTIYVAKIKVLIRCTITAQLICVFVLGYATSSPKGMLLT